MKKKPSPLLMKLLLVMQLLLPLYGLAADEIVFRDKAGRILKKSDLAAASGEFKWEIESDVPVNQEAQKAHALGRAAGQRGDYRAALLHFDKASKLAPSWPYPPYDAAFTYLLQKDFDAAYDYYQRVDRMAPRGFFTTKTAVQALRMESSQKIPKGTYLSYVALEWEADKQKVMKAAQAMNSAIPAFAPAWKTSALLEEDPGRRLALLERGLKAQPDAETRGFLLLNKALVLWDLKKAQEAREILGNLVLDPSSPRDIEALAKRTLAQFDQR